MPINVSMYLIKEPSGVINYWSIADSEDQAWEDFREYYSEAEDGVYRYCETKEVLKTQGYSCVKVDLVGEVLP